MSSPSTLIDKLWAAHEILLRDDGTSLLWVDRHWVHEGSHHAFAKLALRDMSVAEPELTFAVADHYAPTSNRLHIQDADVARMIATLQRNAHSHGIRLFGLDDPRQGIVHVIGPELGLTSPGLLVTCGDSHTSTHGAFAALAFGIGATEVAHVLATQTLWQKKPKALKITINGSLAPGVSAKDIALHWIAALGADSARGYAIEYSMEARMTLCNLSIEGGARFGLVGVDDTTVRYLQNTPHALPELGGAEVVEHWRSFHSDAGASFDREVSFNAAHIAPTVSWGITPAQSIAIDACVPDLDNVEPDKVQTVRAALDYMGLKAGQRLAGTPIDRVFIGSCTNARIEDLRAAAAVLAGRRAKVPGLVSPGSMFIKAMAEAEGLDTVFTQAGLQWVESGCSSCVGMNGDVVPSGQRCASTTNRNFRGRQGLGSRTHLMSPAMVAAAALEGKLVDVREIATEKTLGEAVCLLRENIDTDQILPARFMSQPRTQGYANFLFHDVRRKPGQGLDDEFILNQCPHASILVCGNNFGSGSSREAAVYALVDSGIRVVIATSFGDIFAANAVNNGLLPARVSSDTLTRLIASIGPTSMQCSISLDTLSIGTGTKREVFELDAAWRIKLRAGLDDISLTLKHRQAISNYRKERLHTRPWVWPNSTQ